MQPSDSGSNKAIRELIEQKEAEMAAFHREWSAKHNDLSCELVRLNDLLVEKEIFYHFDPKVSLIVEYVLSDKSKDLIRVYEPLRAHRAYYPIVSFKIKKSLDEELKKLADNHIFPTKDQAIDHAIRRIKDFLW